MTGAVCGAMLITAVLARMKNCFRLFIKIELAIICFAIGCPLIFLAVYEYLGSPSVFFFGSLFLVISFICGLLIGSQFPLANKLYQRNSTSVSETAGLLYASDLMGGWFGGKITAAAMTGPARLPRPTSSRPAMWGMPKCQSCCS